MGRNSNERNVDTSRVSPVGYTYAHVKVGRARGKAHEHKCTRCGRQASQWAYQGGSEYEQQEETTRTFRGEEHVFTLRWSANVWDYEPMCVPCHRALDGDA